jgi:hypothetical protein
MTVSGYEPALRVHNIRSKTTVAYLLQTSNQELKVNDGRDHTQKTTARENWLADEHNRTRRLSTVDDQCLASIGAAFARGGKSPL